MQDFLSEYGLWLLVALLIVIALFLLFGGRRGAGPVPVEPSSDVNADQDGAAVTLVGGSTPTLISPVGDMMPVVLPADPVAEEAADVEAEKAEKAARPKPKPKAAAKAKSASATGGVASTPAAAKPAEAVKPAASKSAASKPAASRPAAAKGGEPDNLLLIKGVGPKVNAILKDAGITRFDQIAGWKAKDLAEIDAKLGTFAGRPERDNWVDQAKLLAKGDTAAFEAKYGKL